MGCTKFTSGAHDVIAITSPQKNYLCYSTEELQNRAFAKTLDEVSLPLKKARLSRVEKGDSGADSSIKFHLGRLF